MRKIIAAIAALTALAVCPLASAQSQPAPNIDYKAPSVTRGAVQIGGRAVAYTATAGLLPIYANDGKRLLGDMSYVAYTAKAPAGGKRPIAFIWNGGPGSNTLPLHYGAFGPKRLEKSELKSNPASLIDAADLVFIDAMQTGFGRVAPEVTPSAMLNADSDSTSFTQFIETWMKTRAAPSQPIFLIGESYGVRRAVTVADALAKRGIKAEGAVLISGYPVVVTHSLDAARNSWLQIPTYAAVAFERGLLKPEVASSAMAVHDAALAWAKSLAAKQITDPAAEWKAVGPDLVRFVGITEKEAAAPPSFSVLTPATFAESVANRAGMSLEDSSRDVYDIRHPEGTFDLIWIRRSVVRDLRVSLGHNNARAYLGLEESAETEPVRNPNNLIEAALREIAERVEHETPGPKPEEGLAYGTVNPMAHWPVRRGAQTPTVPALMTSSPQLDLLIAGGIYDQLFPCSQTLELAERDLGEFGKRVSSKCYRGGHMMYDDVTTAMQLSADIREFINDAR